MLQGGLPQERLARGPDDRAVRISGAVHGVVPRHRGTDQHRSRYADSFLSLRYSLMFLPKGVK